MAEWLILLLVLSSGWSLLVATGLDGWGALPLGFIVGVATSLLAMTVAIVSGFTTSPWVIVAVLVLALVGSLVGARSGGRFGRDQALHLLAGAGILAAMTLAFRSLHLVTYHIDSFRYLVGALLLAEGAYDYAHVSTVEKRMVAAPAMHSLARLFEEDYLRAFGPVLMLAVLAAIIWAAHAAGGRRFLASERYVRGWAIVLGVALLATNSRMVWNTFYINDHLIFAALTLVAAVSSWLLTTRLSSSPAAPLLLGLTLSVSGLVITRPEGFLIGGLLLLPFVTDERVPWQQRAVPTAVFGGTMTSWYAFSVVTRGGLGDAPLAVIGPLLVGLATVAIAASFRVSHRRLPGQRRVLGLTQGALWVSLVAFSFRDAQLLYDSTVATYRNVVGGEGAWGYSLVALATLSVAALIIDQGRLLTALRFPLTSVIPVLFLLVYLRDAPYRVGTGDSLNRMLMQYVPLAVLYVIAVVSTPRASGGQPEQKMTAAQRHDTYGRPHP